jgi:hypothetical protein
MMKRSILSEFSMPEDYQEVVVTDVRVPFLSMVVLMVKWAIAAIPAVVILFFIAGLTSTLLAMLFGAGWHHWQFGQWL